MNLMIYEIKNDELCVKISSHGAELQSVVKNSHEYLWQGDAQYWQRKSPVLFPVVGRCLDNYIDTEDGRFPMPQHGFAHSMEFELAELGDTSCTLVLESNTETKQYYPYDFRFSVTYELSGSEISCRFTTENIGERTLYYTIGAHPGINCPAGHGSFEDWEIVFEHDEPLYSIPVTPQGVITAPKNNDEKNKIDSFAGHVSLSRDLFVPDAMIFENLKSQKITLKHKSDNIGVTMDYSDFPVIAVWTLPRPGADYVCLEPWCGMAHIEGESSELCKKYGVMPLSAGKSDKKGYTLTII